MDFAVPAALAPILARARAILDDAVVPLEATLLADDFFACEGALAEVRAQVKAEGLWAPQLPRELGGMGLSVLEHGLLSEVLGRSPLGHYAFGCQAPDAGNAEILHRWGTPEQKERYLAPLASGAIRSCFSMTEPENPGSNPVQLSCTAVRDGDDYVIDGRKWFTSSADGAAFAIVMAVTQPDAPPHKRASMLVVPTDTPGFRRVRNIPVFGHAGEGYASHAEIAYEACRVPVANRLGPDGEGFAIAQERLGPGRIHHCMRWIGICERAFELLCERAATRRLDRAHTLADKGMVHAWVAEARAEIDAARLAVLHAAWTIDHEGFRAARDRVSLIKFHTAGVLLRTIDRAVQVHGALGLTSDSILSWFYVHERGARIYDGPDETHKEAVARRILARYAPAAPA